MGTLVGFHSGLCMALLLIAAPCAFAQPDDRPAASVDIGPSEPVRLNWRGHGDVGVARPLCISSSTGEFELTVSSFSGAGLGGRAPIPYEVSLEIGGTVHRGMISPSSPYFSVLGRTDRGGDCAGRQNATLTVRLLQRDVLAGVAGSYGDQLNIAIQPR